MTPPSYLVRVGKSVIGPTTGAQAVAALLGPAYLTATPTEQAAWRERFCLAQLGFYPEAALDPRSEVSFLRTLARAKLLEIEES